MSTVVSNKITRTNLQECRDQDPLKFNSIQIEVYLDADSQDCICRLYPWFGIQGIGPESMIASLSSDHRSLLDDFLQCKFLDFYLNKGDMVKICNQVDTAASYILKINFAIIILQFFGLNNKREIHEFKQNIKYCLKRLNNPSGIKCYPHEDLRHDPALQIFYDHSMCHWMPRVKMKKYVSYKYWKIRLNVLELNNLVNKHLLSRVSVQKIPIIIGEASMPVDRRQLYSKLCGEAGAGTIRSNLNVEFMRRSDQDRHNQYRRHSIFISKDDDNRYAGRLDYVDGKASSSKSSNMFMRRDRTEPKIQASAPTRSTVSADFDISDLDVSGSDKDKSSLASVSDHVAKLYILSSEISDAQIQIIDKLAAGSKC